MKRILIHINKGIAVCPICKYHNMFGYFECDHAYKEYDGVVEFCDPPRFKPPKRVGQGWSGVGKAGGK